MRRISKLLSLIVVCVVISTFAFVVGASVDENSSLLGNDSVRKPSEAGALHLEEVDGQMTLVDESGEKIQLRGMITHGLQWFGEIINENAFATLANDWDCNVIRLALYVGESGYATDPALKDLVYQGIDLAFENDMYVIVDWHVLAPGDPNEEVYSGAYDFFDEISSYYIDNPQYDQILWEICNEPSPNTNGGNGITNDAAGWQAVKSYAEPIVELLRSRGDNIIIVGTPNWSQRADLAADDPIDADNIMYATHFYSGTHLSSEDSVDRGNVMANARYALDNGVAVFVSEWGSSEASGNNGPFLPEADKWISFMNENNISWVNWSLTNKNETSGAFIPYLMGISEATLLDPGDDQVWATEEMSISGEFVRARIKGIEYEPIERLAEGAYSQVVWDFESGDAQGFVVNLDSPIKDVVLSNEDGMLVLSNMAKSIDVSDTNYWANVRISSNDYNPGFDAFAADMITMEVYVDNPTTVSIALVPQTDQNGWANPNSAVRVYPDNFVQQDDGKYFALVTTTAKEAANLEVIATDAEGSILSNMVMFAGIEDGTKLYIDNITFSSSGAAAAAPLEHAPQGTASLPSYFEDGTRQGWDWSVDSGTKVNLLVEKVNGSKALAFEFAYPEVKPTDNWASAPRLDLWLDPMTRGENSFLLFDCYLEPTTATTGSIAISAAFQPPEFSYWAQIPDSYNIDLALLSEAEKTEDGLYHYMAVMDLETIEAVADDTQLRNLLLIFADIESDFSGKIYVDNIRLVTQAEYDEIVSSVETDVEPTTEPSAETTTSVSETTASTVSNERENDNAVPLFPIIIGISLVPAAIVAVIIGIFVLKKKKSNNQ